VSPSRDNGGGSHTFAFIGPSPGEAFQVFIVPYTQNTITPERFKIDDPSGVMKDTTTTTVAGVQATSFGYNDQMGDTREVWFIHAGFLYEITTYQPLAPWLMQIVQTWRFI
jgi:hypothetical protein